MSSPRTRPSASRIETFSTPRIGVDSNTIRCASCSCVSPSADSVVFTVSPSSVRLPGPNVHERPALFTECFDLIRNLVIALSCCRIRIEHCKRFTGVGLNDDIGIERNTSEEGHTHVHCGCFSATLPEHLDVIVTVGTL